MSVFNNWLLDKAEQNSFLYANRLSANDTGTTRGHKVGLYISSGIVEKLFPSINHYCSSKCQSSDHGYPVKRC